MILGRLGLINYIVKINFTFFFYFPNVATRKILLTNVVCIIFLLDSHAPYSRFLKQSSVQFIQNLTYATFFKKSFIFI